MAKTTIYNNKQEIIDEELNEIITNLGSSDLSQEENTFLIHNVEVKRVAKGSLLLKEGQIIKASYYLFKGCVREYYLNDGEEKTVAFYTAGEAPADEGDKKNKIPSSVFWECVSDCIISILPYELEKEMYQRFPRLESQCKTATENEFSNYKKNVNKYLASSAEERYLALLKTKPEIFQLVPLYHIASYLGVKPESLSRIRNRMRLS